MIIYKINSNECGGFQKPKGHLDTQMFPECEGTPCDRNISKKYREKQKRKKKSEIEYENIREAQVSESTRLKVNALRLKLQILRETVDTLKNIGYDRHIDDAIKSLVLASEHVAGEIRKLGENES